MKHTLRSFLFASLLLACGDEASNDASFEVRFQASANGVAATCGQELAGIGTVDSAFEMSDLRFYVHNLRAITSSGEQIAAELLDEAPWQGGGVALLDFEDKSANCINGTPETRTFLTARAPTDDITGIAFTLGVPFDLNHQDVSGADAPLSLSGMFWSWSGGYKFLRLDGRVDGAGGYNVHIGSTGCSADSTGAVDECTGGNRVDVVFEDFDPAVDTVVFDLDALFAASNLGADAPPNAGCMSNVDDTDCAGIYGQLGLTFGDVAGTGAQKVFKVADR